MNKKAQVRLAYGLIIGLVLIGIFSAYFVFAGATNSIKDVTISKGANLTLGTKEVAYNTLWETYKPIEIKDSGNKTLFKGAITEHTQYCSNDCLSTIEIYQGTNGVLVDDISFYEIKGSQRIPTSINYSIEYSNTSKDVVIQDYKEECIEKEKLKNGTSIQQCSLVISGNHTIQEPVYNKYILGSPVQAGNYLIKISGAIGSYGFVEGKKIDWVITAENQVMDSWATWTAGLNSGLIHYYNFENTTNNLIDVANTSLGTNGTKGATPENVTGLLGWGNHFTEGDGDRYNFTAPISTGNGVGTLNFWFKTTVLSNAQMMGKYAEAGTFFCYYEGDATKRIFCAINDPVQQDLLSNITGLANNTWHMGTLVWGTGGAQLWQDGVLVATTATTQDLTFKYWLLGGRVDSGSGIIYGTFGMDEIGVWNRRLTEAEIIQLYNGGAGITWTNNFGGNTAPTVSFVAPVDNYNSTSNSVQIQILPIDGENATGLFTGIYTNASGWSFNATNSSSFNNTNTNLTITLPDGIYTYAGFVNDTMGNFSFTTTNRTITIDSTPPVTNFYYPANGTTVSFFNQTFTFNQTDNLGLINSTLYVWNSTGSLNPGSTSPNVYSVYAGGNMWIPNENITSLSKVYPNGTVIQYDGTGHLNYPHGVAYDGSGNLWMPNHLNNHLTKFIISNTTFQDYTMPTSDCLSIAYGGGFVWVGCANNHLYQVFPNNGTVTDRGAFNTVNAYNFYGIAWSPTENAVFMQFYGNGLTGYGLEIHKAYLNGTSIFDWAHEGNGEFGQEGVAIGKSGYVWATLRNAKVVKIDPTTPNSTTVYSGTAPFPDFIAYDGNAGIWTPSNTVPIISRIDTDTGAVTNYTGLGGDALGISYDFNGSMWVASRGSQLVTRVWVNNGTMINYTGIIKPHGIAYDNATLPVNSSNSIQFTQSISGTSNSTSWNYTLPATGTYYFNAYTCDAVGNCAFNSTNYTITISTSDTTPPTITSPANATITYPASLSSSFTATDSGTGVNTSSWGVNDTTYFQISSIGGLTNKTILPARVFILNITVSDNSGNQAYAIYLVTVNQNAETLWVIVNATSPVTYPYNLIVSSNSSTAFTLYRNGTSISNGSTQTLSAGAYNFSVFRTDTQNYSSIYNQTIFIINKGNLTGTLTSSHTGSFSYAYDNLPTTISFSSSNIGDGGVNYTIYRNNSYVGGETVNLPAGAYGYILNSTGGANWSSSSNINSQNLLISKSSDNCRVLFNETSPVNYPTSPRVYSDCTSTFTLYRNSTTITNNTQAGLSAGFYNFTVIRTDQSNYSNFYNETTFQINKANLTGSINSSSGNFTMEVGNATNISYFETNTGDLDVNYTLYNNSIYFLNNTQFNDSAGTDTIILNSTGGVNYSSSSNISTQLLIFQDTTAPTITGLIPLNFGEDKSGTLDFYYQVYDFSPISWCALYIDNSLSQNDTTITKLIQQNFHLASGTFPVESNLRWYISCSDSLGNKRNSEERTLNTQTSSAGSMGSSPGGGGGGGGAVSSSSLVYGLGSTDLTMCKLTYDLAENTSYKTIRQIQESYSSNVYPISQIQSKYNSMTGLSMSSANIEVYIEKWQPLCSDLMNRTLKEKELCPDIYYSLLQTGGEYSKQDVINLSSQFKSNSSLDISPTLINYYIANYDSLCYNIGLSLKFPMQVTPLSVDSNGELQDTRSIDSVKIIVFASLIGFVLVFGIIMKATSKKKEKNKI